MIFNTSTKIKHTKNFVSTSFESIPFFVLSLCMASDLETSDIGRWTFPSTQVSILSTFLPSRARWILLARSLTTPTGWWNVWWYNGMRYILDPTWCSTLLRANIIFYCILNFLRASHTVFPFRTIVSWKESSVIFLAAFTSFNWWARAIKTWCDKFRLSNQRGADVLSEGTRPQSYAIIRLLHQAVLWSCIYLQFQFACMYCTCTCDSTEQVSSRRNP